MANGLGDFDTSTVVYGKFTTVTPSTGAPGTLGGTPAISVYKDNSTTQSTTGITLTPDFDGVTGLNHFAIDTSADATFYAAGSFFDVVITTGTVGGVSAVGYTVGQFTLRKTAALRPTVAGRALDVSTGGEAGVDWANVGSPLSGVNLDNTQIGFVATVNNAVIVGGVQANVITANALATDAVNEIADGVLDRDMSTGTDSGSPTVRTVRQALRFLRNKWQIASGTLTVYKENDSTASWTSTLTGTPGADPVTTSDPA